MATNLSRNTFAGQAVSLSYKVSVRP